MNLYAPHYNIPLMIRQ